MKSRKIITIFGVLAAVLLISSCDLYMGIGDYGTFSHDLRGTWVSNDPSIYSGRLVIGIDRITITGFSEAQTPVGADDRKRPFRGFTKGVALNGYSEFGKIFIEDGGWLQEGISFTIFSAGNFPQERFLRFNFAGRVETLQRL